MSQFVRLIDHSIIDFFVQKAEGLSYCSDQFLKDTPYLLGDGELYGLPGNLPEETSDGLVVAEAFRNGEYIVLQTAQCGSSNLRCEAGTLWHLPNPRLVLQSLKTTSRAQRLEYISHALKKSMFMSVVSRPFHFP